MPPNLSNAIPGPAPIPAPPPASAPNAAPTGTPPITKPTGVPPLVTPPVAPIPTAGSAPEVTSTGNRQKNPNSTQNTLLVSEIRDGLAIMNDGSMRAVVTCRSINFDLMSDRERDAVEFSYQQFLNSLYFPIQIYARSQRVDIGPYLERLVKVRKEQDNMLLGVLMDDYIDFINMLAQETNIMDKSFFIVIPYYVGGDIGSVVNSSKSFLANLFAPQTQQRIRIDENTYNKGRDELKNRVATVVNGLIQMGIRSVQLNTKELGELYYSVYNPDTAVRQPIGDFTSLTSTVTTKGTGNAPQPHLDREAV